MSKVVNYLIFIAVMLIFIHMFTPVGGSTTASKMWDMISAPQNIRVTCTNNSTSGGDCESLFGVINAAFLLAAGAAVLALAFLGNKGNWALTAGMATFLFFIVDELVGIWQVFATFSTWFAILTISPLAIAATLAIAEWWLGMQ